MNKLLTSTALVLALTASGAAFAGSATQADVRTQALYGQPDSIAAAQWTDQQSPWASVADQRLKTGSQQASTAPVPEGSWQPAAPASREDLYNPE
jgi:hypothetical protein